MVNGTYLVAEVAGAGQEAGDSARVAEVKRVLVALASARMDHAAHARVRKQRRAIRERKECVARRNHHGSCRARRKLCARLLNGVAATRYAVHLPGSSAE